VAPSCSKSSSSKRQSPASKRPVVSPDSTLSEEQPTTSAAPPKVRATREPKSSRLSPEKEPSPEEEEGEDELEVVEPVAKVDPYLEDIPLDPHVEDIPSNPVEFEVKTKTEETQQDLEDQFLALKKEMLKTALESKTREVEELRQRLSKNTRQLEPIASPSAGHGCDEEVFTEDAAGDGWPTPLAEKARRPKKLRASSDHGRAIDMPLEADLQDTAPYAAPKSHKDCLQEKKRVLQELLAKRKALAEGCKTAKAQPGTNFPPRTHTGALGGNASASSRASFWSAEVVCVDAEDDVEVVGSNIDVGMRP